MSTKLSQDIAVGDRFYFRETLLECIGEHRPSPNQFGLPWFRFAARILEGDRLGDEGDVVFGPDAVVKLGETA
jgi:hypothetical protein